MSGLAPQEIARDVISLVTTAGVKKDIIDLLEKKVALLTEKISILEAENAELKGKAVKLEQQLDRLRPQQGRLEEGGGPEKLLQVLSRPHRPSLEQAARELGIKQIVAEHHANVLDDAGMIELSAFLPGKGTMYSLTPKGTAYVVENNLAD
jgi:DNA-binding transcriptional ArsR family regulator